ncbi:MAG: thiamine biosynthesis oxidoreductase ThiO [Porticoccaceae bacterium]|nr:MAG: thiamine biosynthesis oxidoreductase ThiO [Porticoccaceae bacterium]
MKCAEVVVAGGGIAGRLLAWRLLRGGRRVLLVDRDPAGGASAAWVAAAMLAPASEAVTSGPEVLAPGLAALEQWRQWLAELAADAGRVVPAGFTGSLVVAHPADRAELSWFAERLARIAGGEELAQSLDRAGLADLEPELGRFDGGLWLPREGWLDNRALFAALAEAIAVHGGQWLAAEVRAVFPGRVETDRGPLSCALAVDCRGFGAKGDWPALRGVRGEVARVRAPEVALSRPVRLLHPRYQLYVAPRPDRHYVIGATELESESLAGVTVRSALELLSALYSLHPGFGEAEILELAAHCRPAFADHLPRVAAEPGLLRANGLYRHGYLLGPALVESALAALAERPPAPPVRREEAPQLESVR